MILLVRHLSSSVAAGLLGGFAVSLLAARLLSRWAVCHSYKRPDDSNRRCAVSSRRSIAGQRGTGSASMRVDPLAQFAWSRRAVGFRKRARTEIARSLGRSPPKLSSIRFIARAAKPHRPGGRRLWDNHGTKTYLSTDYAIISFPDIVQSIGFSDDLYPPFAA